MKGTLDTQPEVTPSTLPARDADPWAALVLATPAHRAKANRQAVAQRLINLDRSYHGMDAAALHREFKRLDSIAKKEGKNAKQALERAIPHLSAIQMLTSQRGAMRKQLLAEAGVPGWSDYLNMYSNNYGVSASTIKRRIVAYRGKSEVQPKPKKEDPPPPPPKLTAAQTRKAIKAVTIAGDAFAAYKAGDAIEPFVEQWDKVAFTPEEQATILDMLEGNVDPDTELNEKATSIIKTGESYVLALEEVVPWNTLTAEQKETLRKRSEPWRKLLRYVAALEARAAA